MIALVDETRQVSAALWIPLPERQGTHFFGEHRHTICQVWVFYSWSRIKYPVSMRLRIIFWLGLELDKFHGYETSIVEHHWISM